MAEEKKEQLKLHHLQPAPGSKKEKIRVGRGEGGRRGKTAGRGTKGLKARNTLRPGFEGGQTPLLDAHPQAPRVHQPEQGGIRHREPRPRWTSSTRAPR